MFQFTTTNVINSDFEYGYTPTGEETVDKPYALWSLGEDKNGEPTFNVKRHLNFKKKNVVSITKANYVPSKNGKVTLDLNSLKSLLDEDAESTTFRIAMYIKLAMASQNSYYSNDLVFKGKPIYIEFVWKKDQDADKVAKNVKDIVKKYFITVYEKPIVKVTNESDSVVIYATDEFQRFTKVDIEKYIPSEIPYHGGYKVVASATTAELADGTANPEFDGVNTIEQGVEGFGTYSWILRNLRLPTGNRLAFGAINQDESPILGAQYDQYVIRYCVNRGIMGGDAVGEVTKSLTTHVFFVNKTVSNKFEAALKDFSDVEVVKNSLETTETNGKVEEETVTD